MFKVILGIFQFFGMTPVSLHGEKSQLRSQNITLAFWSLLQLILLIILITLVFTSEGIFGAHNYIGEFNEEIKAASLFATHLVILVEAFFSRNELAHFWQKITELDSNVLLQFDVHPRTFERRFIRKFFINILFVLLVEIIIIANVQDDPLWTNLWYLGITSLTITRLRHLHLMLHVDTISFRLKVIRKELQRIVSTSQGDVQFKGSNSKIDKSAFHKLCLMKNAYNTLYECSSHVNFSFGFSQLFNLMQNFVQLTCDLYWIYSILYRNDLTYMLVLILLLVPTFQVIIVTLSSCERSLKEVREIGFLLHNVEKEPADTRMDMLIENFSLQILHEPFNISVTGFFNMDFTLLKAVRRGNQ